MKAPSVWSPLRRRPGPRARRLSWTQNETPAHPQIVSDWLKNTIIMGSLEGGGLYAKIRETMPQGKEFCDSGELWIMFEVVTERVHCHVPLCLGDRIEGW